MKTKQDEDSITSPGDKFKKFLEYDKKILRFKGYWDDRTTSFGYLHLLQVRYFLCDDTIEIVEMPENADDVGRHTLLKKIKLPKVILDTSIDNKGTRILRQVRKPWSSSCRHTFLT